MTITHKLHLSSQKSVYLSFPGKYFIFLFKVTYVSVLYILVMLTSNCSSQTGSKGMEKVIFQKGKTKGEKRKKF